MMKELTLTCDDERRRHDVRQADYNGLDYLEVSRDQRCLTVFFLGKAPAGLTPAHFHISGGRRIRNIQVVHVARCPQKDLPLDDCLVLTVDRPGDFSTYRLCLVELGENGRPTGRPYPNFDPRYACLDFSFKVNCPSDLDCRETAAGPPQSAAEPEINYLARDYASLRQLILDRLALIMPEWQEGHVPDLGITLVELLAYSGDYLSYYQDAVATEAYLETARQRVSVRRHARLVDYAMHEGCNARAWLCLEVANNLELDPDDTTFVTRLGDVLPLNGVVIAEDTLRQVAPGQYEMYAPLVSRRPRRYRVVRQHQRWTIEAVDGPAEPIKLYQAHNRLRFYTWGDQECCLPQGATSATLVDGPAVVAAPEPDGGPAAAQPASPGPAASNIIYQRQLDQLKEGDFLIFEEVAGPKSGNPADADPNHRHVVRLTKLEKTVDELYRQPLLEITWAEADALPFPLCISAVSVAPDCRLLHDVSVAYGNVILVDHGRPVRDEALGCVPTETSEADCECGRLSDVRRLPGRFRPRLQGGPLTFSQPLPEQAAASALLTQDPRQALPWIQLAGFADAAPGPGRPEAKWLPATAWAAQPDLFGSAATSRHFVAEMAAGGRASLRFGDGELGYRPQAGRHFLATYRTGNGPAGNVGAEAIAHLVYRRHKQDGIRQVRNPLPARGGVAAESLDEARLFAPYIFRRRLERAITADDYAQIVMRDFPLQVQRAAASLRWTGSWYEALVAVDARGQVQADQALLDKIAAHLHRYRRLGHDVVVRAAHQVALDIALRVCVRPSYLRGHVKGALLDLFSSRIRRDGQPGFFHPDNLSFGEGIHLSKMVGAAQAVTGVESVSVERLERRYEGANGEIEAGILPLGPFEVARLDNDPSFPENGLFTLEMEGGR